MEKMIKSLSRSAKEIRKLRTLIMCALFVGIGVVLNTTTSIYLTESLKLSLTFVPITLAALLFGPIPSGFVGAIIDFVGYLIKPAGPYFLGFTISGFFVGFISGLILYNQSFSFLRVVLTRVLVNLFVHIGLNSVWLMILYDRAFIVGLAARCIKNAILAPIEIVILLVLWQALRKILPQFFPDFAASQRTQEK